MDTTTVTTSPRGAMTRAVGLALAVVTGAALLLGLLAGAVADPAPAPAPAAPATATTTATTTTTTTATPPTPAALPPAPAHAEPARHTVAEGETLALVAQRYGVPTELLAADNGLADADRIAAGQVLTVATPPTDVVVVGTGATLSGYAQQYATTVDALLALNPQIADPDRILAGAGLRVAAS